MRAIAIEEFGGAEKLKMVEVSTPQPLDNEVQIEIAYTAVNPVDWKIREGLFKTRLPFEFPLILGWDAAGTISAIGKGVKKLKVGDEVYAYCRKPLAKWGTYAQYVCMEAENVALKPKTLSFKEAASIPLAGLTAWQSLFDAGKVSKGEQILIHAGAGGVGGFAIQFAKVVGATIYTTASIENHEYVKKLGAKVAIDYKRERVSDIIKKHCSQGLDFVFDTIGGKTLRESLDWLKVGGRVVSLLEEVDPSLTKARKIKSFYVFVKPSGVQLTEIAQLIDEGKVAPPHIEEMPLEEAAQAQERVRTTHTRGKIVLKVSR